MGSGLGTGGKDRRTLLKSVGVSLAVGATALGGRSGYVDDDGDGIPDHIERSAAFEERLADCFGADQVESIDPDRPNLLIDARYVEGTGVSDAATAYLEDLFREHGIHAQWLDYPHVYDREHFEASYGAEVRSVLWGRSSFYREEVESWLRDVAVQIVVVPGEPVPGVRTVEDAGDGGGALADSSRSAAGSPPTTASAAADVDGVLPDPRVERVRAPPRQLPGVDGLQPRVFSHQLALMGGGIDGYANGFSVGNRAIVADRRRPARQAELLLHEIAHLGVCHDDDPDNPGVMGASEVVDLAPAEWEQLRANLPNVHDQTGFDVLFRPCLWSESLRG